MTTHQVLAAFVAFILLCLAGIGWWIRKAQTHFDRLDDHRGRHPEPLRRRKTDRA